MEAKRILVSRYESEQTRGGKPLKLHVREVRKAYFNGAQNKTIYLKLPYEMCLGENNILGKLRKCNYGTQGTRGLSGKRRLPRCSLALGLCKGSHHPAASSICSWGVPLVVHGDDFTALGSDDGLDKYEKGMLRAFECDIRGRLGPEAKDAKEIKILNRSLRVVPEGLRYEADPGHAELLATALGAQGMPGGPHSRRQGLQRGSGRGWQTPPRGRSARPSQAAHKFAEGQACKVQSYV